MRSLRDFFGSANHKKITPSLRDSYAELLRAYQKTINDIDAVNESIKLLCKDPTYNPLLDLLKEKEEARKIVRNAERKLHDCQTKIARELGIMPERIHDYTIDTRTGRVRLKTGDK